MGLNCCSYTNIYVHGSFEARVDQFLLFLEKNYPWAVDGESLDCETHPCFVSGLARAIGRTLEIDVFVSSALTTEDQPECPDVLYFSYKHKTGELANVTPTMNLTMAVSVLGMPSNVNVYTVPDYNFLAPRGMSKINLVNYLCGTRDLPTEEFDLEAIRNVFVETGLNIDDYKRQDVPTEAAQFAFVASGFDIDKYGT